MNITEKDIFDFVFYPLELNPAKKKFISDNLEKFAQQIEILKKLENNSTEVDEKLIASFEFKSKNFGKRQKSKTLLKQDSGGYPKKNEVWKFAAASMKLNKKIITETFMDVDSKYLLKLLVSNKLTKMFLFANDNSQLKNMKVTLYPSGESYLMQDNSRPLEIEGEIIADSITIEPSNQ